MTYTIHITTAAERDIINASDYIEFYFKTWLFPSLKIKGVLTVPPLFLKIKEILSKTFPCLFMVFMISQPFTPTLTGRTRISRLSFVIFTHIPPCPAFTGTTAAPIVM